MKKLRNNHSIIFSLCADRMNKEAKATIDKLKKEATNP